MENRPGVESRARTTLNIKKPNKRTHERGGAPSKAGAELCEVLQVRLIQHVAHDLDVHLVEILAGYAPGEVRSQRGVDEHEPVQLAHAGGHCECCDAIEHAQGVAFAEEVLHVPFVEGTL